MDLRAGSFRDDGYRDGHHRRKPGLHRKADNLHNGAETPSNAERLGAVDVQSLVYGGLSLASGLVVLIFPRRSRLKAEAKVAARKAQLAAGASERFFEERRTLEAYPLAPTDRRWRLKGLFFTLLGAALIVLSYFR